jgi:molybdenum cofactor cytidylyltransferase
MSAGSTATPAQAAPTPGGPRVVGVVLAAGAATRMGGAKVLLPVGGRPMVERVVDAALASRLADVLVVTGNEGDEVRRILAGKRVRVIDNPSFGGGLSTSVHAALRHIGHEADAALFLHADQPFVTAGLIDRLLDEHAAAGKLIVRPESDGRAANPVLFPARLFPELERETGDRGGRDVAQRHAAEVHLVPVDDPRLCLDVDSPEDYERFREG